VKHNPNSNSRPSEATLIVILFALLLPTPAHAYIDPNATNLFTQSLTPLLVVGIAAVTFLRTQTRSAIGRLASWFRRK
jgi:hypothetical protein